MEEKIDYGTGILDKKGISKMKFKFENFTDITKRYIDTHSSV